MRLQVIFYIADCHMDASTLKDYVHKVQAYKTIPEGVLPLKVHEELVEVSK